MQLRRDKHHFLYCLIFPEDTCAYRAAPQNDAGFFLGAASSAMSASARAIRDEVVRLSVADGRHEQARRLLLPGEAGQPDEGDFPYVARVLGVAFEVTQEDIPMAPLVYGHGAVGLRVMRTRSIDPAGHASWHYVIQQVWRSSAVKRRRLVGKTSSTGVVSISLPVPVAASVFLFCESNTASP